MKKLRILILFDTDADPPAGQDYSRQIESADEAEFDVARAPRAVFPGFPELPDAF